MATTYETGHARNVSHFEQIIAHCVGLGEIFNPSNHAITIEATNQLLTRSRGVINLVSQKHNLYSEAVDAREILFQNLDKFVTRLLRAMQSSTITDEKIEDAKTIIRKIKGQRAKSISQNTAQLIDNQIEDSSLNQPVKKSSSQRSYDNRLENFAKLIDLLQNDPNYSPNETELKTTTLLAMVADMRAKNTAVLNALVALTSARIQRDKILYSNNTGLVDVARDLKAYIGALFGTTSPEYKTIMKITFSNYSK